MALATLPRNECIEWVVRHQYEVDELKDAGKHNESEKAIDYFQSASGVLFIRTPEFVKSLLNRRRLHAVRLFSPRHSCPVKVAVT
jgi:hypothetical protein